MFTFGALVLEVVFGQRPIQPHATLEEFVLAEWAWEQYAAEEVVDARLGSKFDVGKVTEAVKVGLCRCGARTLLRSRNL